jgi:hypothetical protein
MAQRSSAGDTMSEILDGYIPEAKFCAAAGIKLRTARTWRQKRTGPPWVRIGRDVFYRVTSLQEWLEAKEVRPTRPRTRVAERDAGKAA